MLLSNTSSSDNEIEIPGLKTYCYYYSKISSLSSESSGVMIEEYSKEDFTFDLDISFSWGYWNYDDSLSSIN